MLVPVLAIPSQDFFCFSYLLASSASFEAFAQEAFAGFFIFFFLTKPFSSFSFCFVGNSLCRLLLSLFSPCFAKYQLLHSDLVVAGPHLMWSHCLLQAFQLSFHFFFEFFQLLHISIIHWSLSFFRVDQNPLLVPFFFFGEALLQAFQLCFASFQLCSWIFTILQLECLCQAFQLAKCFVALPFQMLALLQVLSISLFQAFLGGSFGTASCTAKQHPLWRASDLQVCFHPFKVLVIQSLTTHLLASLCQAFMAQLLLVGNFLFKVVLLDTSLSPGFIFMAPFWQAFDCQVTQAFKVGQAGVCTFQLPNFLFGHPPLFHSGFFCVPLQAFLVHLFVCNCRIQQENIIIKIPLSHLSLALGLLPGLLEMCFSFFCQTLALIFQIIPCSLAWWWQGLVRLSAWSLFRLCRFSSLCSLWDWSLCRLWQALQLQTLEPLQALFSSSNSQVPASLQHWVSSCLKPNSPV